MSGFTIEPNPWTFSYEENRPSVGWFTYTYRLPWPTFITVAKETSS